MRVRYGVGAERPIYRAHPYPPQRPAPKADVLCGTDEEACLKQLAGLARRDGDHLHLRLANGKTRTFTTTTEACEANIYEKCLNYHLRGYYARHRYFMLDANFLMHGGVTLLVSARNGEYVKLDTYPKFSPSGRQFAAVNATESDGDNSIEIWSTASDPPRSEWRYVVPTDEYSLYEFVEWEGDDRLKMTVTTRIGEELHEGMPVEAVRAVAGWRLMPPMPLPTLVTVRPEPAYYAWYLRADFHPRHTSVRGIPVRQLIRSGARHPNCARIKFRPRLWWWTERTRWRRTASRSRSRGGSMEAGAH